MSTQIEMTTDKALIRTMCQAIVAEAHPGYHNQYHTFIDIESWGIYQAQTNRAWNPWHDKAKIVSVNECFNLENINADASVDWHEEFGNLASSHEILETYCDAENAREDNGDLAEWVNYCEVVVWAENNNKTWKEEIDAYKDMSHEAAIDLVESCILSIIEID